ncbi:MAG: PqqD family protein [Ignavibacteriae bacterium HGW-Ignavibacteriae-3]|nr:MAG: PqqD family protein [Ignavibacteriae bacterium HGW-Ignavibacteriae-3]
MRLSFSERRKILKGANYLELTPLRIKSEEVNEENLVNIVIPKFANKFAAKFIVPKLKSPVIKIKLDELGSAVWLLIDGKRSVAQIARLLTEKFGDKIEPVNERLPKYLTGLYEQQFITFQEINKGD